MAVVLKLRRKPDSTANRAHVPMSTVVTTQIQVGLMETCVQVEPKPFDSMALCTDLCGNLSHDQLIRVVGVIDPSCQF